jgi:P27 family predicted phage terminase small subunit
MPKGKTGRPVGRPRKSTGSISTIGVTHSTAQATGGALKGSGGIPTPPPLSAEGLELWNLIWSAGRTWISPDSDHTIVKMLCEAQDEYESIRNLLASGEVERSYITPSGQVVTHPLVGQLSSLRNQISSWLAAIGFSPSDRSRLGIIPVKASWLN